MMAGALAISLKTAWAPEFARYYVGGLNRPYERSDLRFIGRGQIAWEDWHARLANRFLVCDTDWTVLQVWEEYRYGAPPDGSWEWQKGYENPSAADLYLLCAPDFPWRPDSLREHPLERDILFSRYEQLLASSGANYIVLHGSHTQRLEAAITQIIKLFAPL